MGEDTKATVADDTERFQALPEKEPRTGRFAVYDTVLARYVGGVGSKGEAEKAAAEGDHLTVRQV